MDTLSLRLTIICLFAASSMTILGACSPRAATPATEIIRPVATVAVGAGGVGTGGSYSAEIRPRIESQLAFRVGGKVVERLVEIGSSVRKNQVLMRLDPADLQLSARAALAQVAAAKANDDVAQAALKRAQDLAKQNFISAGALDQAVGAANVSRASLSAAEATSSLGVNAAQYGELRADSDGVVTALSAEVGQIVAAGTPVLKVSAGSQKDVVFSAPEAVVGLLKRGAVIDVQLWAKSGVTMAAIVRDVAAIADPQTRTFAIKATLSDAGNAAPLGSTATVSLKAAAAGAGNNAVAPVLMIPLASVLEAQGKTAVWVVETVGNVTVVKKRAVTLAAALPESSADAQVAVASGLAAGAVVVTAGIHTLTEGQKVRSLVKP